MEFEIAAWVQRPCARTTCIQQLLNSEFSVQRRLGQANFEWKLVELAWVILVRAEIW